MLINGIIGTVDDLDLRLHYRSQMDSAGLQRILQVANNFGVPTLDKQIRILLSVLEDDEHRLRERLDQEILRDLNNPQDVYDAIFSRTRNTKARDYFLSMMRHLLLIREEGAPMEHYYQLIDSLVTDVVLDKKLSGAEARFGYSVERIIAQLNEADRYQFVEEEANNARAEAMRLKLQNEVLEHEIAEGQDGLVGRLKQQLMAMEQKLANSRETTTRLQGQLEVQKSGYEQQIAQLELQILELFKMLKEMGSGEDKIFERLLDTSNGGMDRKHLVKTLEKHFQRHQAFSILEGRDKKNTRGATADDEGEDDLERTPGKSSALRRGSRNVKKKTALEPGRDSQFLDADDAEAETQVQQQLVAGARVVSPFCMTLSRWAHPFLSTRLETFCKVPEVFEAHP